MDPSRLLMQARRGSGLTQRQLAELAGTSQAALSEYERGLKIPHLDVAERIVEAAGFRLDVVTLVHFERRASSGVRPFWVPDRLWRGKLPECFATISMPDPARFEGVKHFDLRRRVSRKRVYGLLIRRGFPDELIDWIDGALLIDLWDELELPRVVREAWEPAVELASKGPVVQANYRGPHLD